MIMDIKVMIAVHKPYRMPSDPVYMPIHVGYKRKKNLGYIGDHTGDNISEKNPNFCELTALYWAWKNLDADYIGLAHYRRHFRGAAKSEDKFECILTKAEMEKIFEDYDLILPRKRHYVIETVKSHYAHTHEPEALSLTRQILAERCPEYVGSFDRVMRHSSAHMFNMLIAKRELYDAYCTWLFDVLFELEKQLDISGYSTFEARVFGRIGELLLNVWVEKNRIPYKEVPYIFMEEPKWNKKITNFLLAKFLHKKYSGSV
jgi:hypothetical protein